MTKVGVPHQVRRLLGGAADLGRPLGLHLYNTRNAGYAYAALECDVTTLDASVAGIGGCSVRDWRSAALRALCRGP